MPSLDSRDAKCHRMTDGAELRARDTSGGFSCATWHGRLARGRWYSAASARRDEIFEHSDSSVATQERVAALDMLGWRTIRRPEYGTHGRGAPCHGEASLEVARTWGLPPPIAQGDGVTGVSA